METTSNPTIDWETETVSQCAQRAARRAIEAISRVGTLTRDLAIANDRIASLEARAEETEIALGVLLAMIEAKNSPN